MNNVTKIKLNEPKGGEFTSCISPHATIITGIPWLLTHITFTGNSIQSLTMQIPPLLSPHLSNITMTSNLVIARYYLQCVIDCL